MSLTSYLPSPPKDVSFADGLFLTNQSTTDLGATTNDPEPVNSIVQIEYVQPDIEVKKGVVSTDAADPTFTPTTVGPVGFAAAGSAGAPFSGAITTAGLETSPIDANLSGVDAGDLVRFAITLHNTGQLGAFDLLVTDTLPGGFEVVPGALNLRATAGDGTSLSFTDSTDGAIAAGTEADFLFTSGANGNGIKLVDAGGNAAIGAGITDPTNNTVNASGSNVVIVTYDLRAIAGVTPSQTITNTATLDQFAARDAGTDLTAGNTGPWQDTAEVTVDVPTAQKSLVSTSEGSTSGSNVTIGERVTYRLTVTVPEGNTTNLSLVDDLPAGMQYVAGSASVDATGFAGTVGGLTVNGGAAEGAAVTFAIAKHPSDRL